MEKVEINDEKKSISFNYGDQSETYKFFPEKKEFRFHAIWPDGSGSSKAMFEYKLSNNPIEIFIRLKEKSAESNIGDSVDVKEGVVLEYEIKKEGHFVDTDPEGKKHISDLKKQVEWQKTELTSGYLINFYILSLHPEIISKEDYRKFLRQTEQRIKVGLTRVEERLKRNNPTGVQILEGDYGRQLWYPKEKELKEGREKGFEYVRENFYKPLFDGKSSEFCGISEDEFKESPFIIKHIDFLLNKKEATSKAEDKKTNEQNKKSSRTKWIVVIALSIMAIYWGVWTAIGVFILGTIIISILPKQ